MAVTQWLMPLTVVALVSLATEASDVDFRSFDFGDEDTEFFSSYEKAFNDHEYFPTDLNLGSLELISSSPKFAKSSSYVEPSEAEVARSKRKTASSEEQSDEEEGDEKHGGGGSDDYADRYEQFVSRHFRERDQQRKLDDAKGEGANYEYRFDYSPSDDYERIKQESEAQGRQLAKDPKNCKAYTQDGMLCHVCRDPATDTTSESCAYATAPHHKKFAYMKQKNYNSKDNENKKASEEVSDDDTESERDVEEADADDEESEETTQAPVLFQGKRAEHITNRPQKPKVIPTKKPVSHMKPGQGAHNGGGYRYQPIDMRSNKERPTAPQDMGRVIHPTYSDFYTHFFPSHGSSHSQKIQQQEPANSDDVYVLSYRDKDEVSKVLADFEARDWSNCKKGKKNELTCYTCTDKDDVKHEECMYVSESRQVSAKVLPSTTPAAPAMNVPKPTKKPQRKKVASEKKAISPKLKNVAQKTLSGKLVALKQLEPSEQGSDEVLAPSRREQERQTVKRTVSIKSHVDGPGRDTLLEPLNGERVVHYEHHVTHAL